MVETGPFFVRERTVDSEGGGGGGRFLKINILAVKHLKINFLGPWENNKIIMHPSDSNTLYL